VTLVRTRVGRDRDTQLLEAVDAVHPDALVLYDRDVAPALTDVSEIDGVYALRGRVSDWRPGGLAVVEWGEIVLAGGRRFWRLVETTSHPLHWLLVRDGPATYDLTPQFLAVYRSS